MLRAYTQSETQSRWMVDDDGKQSELHVRVRVPGTLKQLGIRNGPEGQWKREA